MDISVVSASNWLSLSMNFLSYTGLNPTNCII